MWKKVREKLAGYSGVRPGPLRRAWKRAMQSTVALRGAGGESGGTGRESGKSASPPARKAANHYLNKGVHKYNARRYEEAEVLFQKAIDHDPSHARAYLYHGNACYKMRAKMRAVHSWRCAVEAEPDSRAAANAEQKLERFGRDGEENISVLHGGPLE